MNSTADSKNIWYFHPYGGGPGVGRYFRPFELGRRWCAAGHEVNVFIAKYHHLLDSGELPWAETCISGVSYHSLAARTYRGNGVGRILNMIDYFRGMVKLSHRIDRDLKRPNAIIVSSPHPFVVYAGLWLSKKIGCPLVYEVRDLWPLSLTALLGVSPLHPFALLCGHAERIGYRRADLVATLLSGVGDYIRERGIEPKSITWVPNGLNTNGVPVDSPESANGIVANDQIDRWRAEGRAIMIFAGSIGPPNGIDVMLDSIKITNKKVSGTSLGVLVLGSGVSAGEIETRARTEGLENIIFVPSVPKAEALYLIAKSDFGYAGLRDVPSLYKYGTSLNKVMDYFQCGIPVIIPISLHGDPVLESGGGLSLPRDDPELVGEAIARMIRMSPSERKYLGEKGRAFADQTFDWQIVADRYLEAIGKLSVTVPTFSA